MRQSVLKFLALCLVCAIVVVVTKAVQRGNDESQIHTVAERFTQALLRGDIESMRDDLEAGFDARLSADLNYASGSLGAADPQAKIQIRRITMLVDEQPENKAGSRSQAEPVRKAEARVIARVKKARVSFTLHLVKLAGYWRIDGIKDVAQHPQPPKEDAIEAAGQDADNKIGPVIPDNSAAVE